MSSDSPDFTDSPHEGLLKSSSGDHRRTHGSAFYFSVTLKTISLVAFLIALVSFTSKCLKGPAWAGGVESGLAHDLNSFVEHPIIVFPCVAIFAFTVSLIFIVKTVSCLRFAKNSRPLDILNFVGIFLPLAIQGLPLLAFSLDVVLSFGMGGIDIHVLQAFAVFGAMFLGHCNEAVFLLLLFRSAHSIEYAAYSKAMGALELLEESTPSKAWILSSPSALKTTADASFKGLSLLDRSAWKLEPVSSVNTSQIVKVYDGELVPLKGEILPFDTQGDSTHPQLIARVTQAHVDGELTPVKIHYPGSVASGSFLIDGGPLYLRVTHREEDGEIGRLRKLLRSADENKATLHSVFERFGTAYSKLMIFLTLAILFGLPKLPKGWAVPMWCHRGSAFRALAFIVAGAPCALILSTPIAYWCTFSTLLWNGVKLSEISIVHKMSAVSDVIFDKTGTLTTNLTVGGVWSFDDNDFLRPIKIPVGSKKLQRLASAARLLETNVAGCQPHAYATLQWAVHTAKRDAGILKHNSSRKGTDKKVEALVDVVLKDPANRGVKGTLYLDGVKYLGAVGSVDYIASVIGNDEVKEIEMAFKKRVLRGLSVVALSTSDLRGGKQQWEIFALSYRDKYRKGANEAIEELHKLGKVMWILSGDKESRVKDIAGTLGVPMENVKFEHGPQEKLQLVQQLEKNGARVAMVGDEINDAAAMKASTIGVAISDSTSQVMLSTDLAKVILEDDVRDGKPDVLGRLPFAFREATRCQRIIIQNIIVACFGLLIVAPAAVAGQIPFWLAVLGHEGGTVVVALNSLRLLYV